MKRFRRATALVTLVVLPLTALAACGDDTTESAATEPAAADQTTTPLAADRAISRKGTRIAGWPEGVA